MTAALPTSSARLSVCSGRRARTTTLLRSASLRQPSTVRLPVGRFLPAPLSEGLPVPLPHTLPPAAGGLFSLQGAREMAAPVRLVSGKDAPEGAVEGRDPRLQSLFERLEALYEERKRVGNAIKDLNSEIKSARRNPKVLGRIVKRKAESDRQRLAREAEEHEEQQTLFDLGLVIDTPRGNG